MRIVNAANGQLQPIPFNLGESGRGRWFEEVKVSNRSGQEPSGPEDVSYFTFGQDRRHVILTKGDDKRGILLRISTAGTYTRGSCGRIALKGGTATKLTSGQWAEGNAGNVANGPDELWHVEGPALFVVVLQGGESKGYGHRYLIVTKSLRTVMIKRTELCQLIATDDDPEVAEVVRMCQGDLHEDVQQALHLADELEQMDSVQVDVTHLTSEWLTIEEVVKSFGLAIPSAMGEKVTGISNIQSGTLVPGDKALVAFEVGPGGGKRYRFEEVSEAGIVRVKEVCERPYTGKSVLGIIQEDNWYSAWIEFKDGTIMAYTIADSGGVHRLSDSGQISTQVWAGVTATAPNEAAFKEVFSLNASATVVDGNTQMLPAKPDPEPQAPAGGWTTEDLRAKFARR